MTEPFEILLVEDYEPDVQLVLRHFKKSRIANTLHVVTDGVQALDFVFCRGAYSHRKIGCPPLVVILDIRLPKVDGWEVLQRIKQDPRTAGIPVIMISGSLFSEESEKSRQLGAEACIQKPLRIADLQAALAKFGYTWSILPDNPK